MLIKRGHRQHAPSLSVLDLMKCNGTELQLPARACATRPLIGPNTFLLVEMRIRATPLRLAPDGERSGSKRSACASSMVGIRRTFAHPRARTQPPRWMRMSFKIGRTRGAARGGVSSHQRSDRVLQSAIASNTFHPEIRIVSQLIWPNRIACRGRRDQRSRAALPI